jgi:DNA replication initiation complex subunit (GINS family)
MTVRVLQGEGAIIGVDMREYGPFEAGEIAYLPEVHARIFITNGVAKQIFPSG